MKYHLSNNPYDYCMTYLRYIIIKHKFGFLFSSKNEIKNILYGNVRFFRVLALKMVSVNRKRTVET